MRTCLTLLLALLVWTSEAAAGNWSQWRGPEQNGVARDRDLPDTWSPNPNAANNNLIWKAPYGGRSTPLVQNGRLYLINKVGEGLTEQERVMCFNEEDGKLLHEHRFNVFLTDIVSVRLGWTNLAGDPDTGNVYAHGTQGLFFCFDKDLKVVWSRSMTEEYGRVSGYGGRVTSPIVDGDLVILGMLNASWGENAIGRQRFVAFNKKTGAVAWWASTGFQPKDTYYSVPIVTVIRGERLLISGGGDGGVHAFKVRTGEKVWSYIFGTGAVNCSPVADGDLIYIGHGEENEGNTQGRVICVDGGKVENGKPKLVWQVDGIKVKFASPILDKGRLYVCDEVGGLYCLDGKDGKEIWTYNYGRNTKGSPVLADGKIYIPEADSKFHILKPGDKECTELHKQIFRKKAGGADVALNGSPAVCNNRVYFMTSDELYCIGKKDGMKGANPIPAPRAEMPAPNAKPAHLQIFPAEVVVNPGDSFELKALAYDEHGRPLGEVKATWELAGQLPPQGAPPPPPNAPKPAPPPPLAGELSAKEGTSVKVDIAKFPPVQFGRVVAKLGDLSTHTRVRVAPRLPYAMNLVPVPEGRAPSGWVNCQGKFLVTTLRDRKVLKKNNTIPSPLVARANAYIGVPTLSDYTIEADEMGTKLKTDMPDMGLTNTRYTLMLDGNKQVLRLMSWEALPRVDKTIAFAWKPEVWYRLKLTATVVDGKGTIRGKVWERDQPEPPDWSVEFVDPSPNTEGAPAIYGFSTGIQGPQEPGTAIYYDNVKVNPNKAAK